MTIQRDMATITQADNLQVPTIKESNSGQNSGGEVLLSNAPQCRCPQRGSPAQSKGMSTQTTGMPQHVVLTWKEMELQFTYSYLCQEMTLSCFSGKMQFLHCRYFILESNEDHSNSCAQCWTLNIEEMSRPGFMSLAECNLTVISPLRSDTHKHEI